MIRVFGATDKVFTSNGDVVLQPVKAVVHKEENGDYYLLLETGLEYSDYIVEDNIVVAPTPSGEQAFRISNVTKTPKKITTKAWHVFYDSKNYLVAYSKVEAKTGSQALTQVNNATDPTSEFATTSDIISINDFTFTRMSLYDCVLKILEIWGATVDGGSLIRNNFSIAVNEYVEQDNGVVIRYGKNIKDISVEENWDDVVTKLMPVGKDGTLLNILDPSADVYITSTTQYDVPYTKAITFQQDINRDDYDSEFAYKSALLFDLQRQAQEYLAKNCVPQINYTLRANPEKVSDIGDIIQVIDERIGVNITTHVIAFDYDCIMERFTDVQFGNFKPTLSNLIPNIVSIVKGGQS